MEKEIVTHIRDIPIYRNYTENIPYNPALSGRARALRKSGVISEVTFWIQVHKKKFFNIDFDRQKIIGNYIVDFYIKTLSLIIEIDGTSHNDKDVYDEKRDAYFISQGLRIYKISDLRVKHDLDNVMRELESFIIDNYSS
ncbi:endonuclease domain-containing protein [Flavobacterium sp. DGU11]|uniref:Endonuclease domain-containing protein n=1 Tax=Flavobacterium arundinis TaxID=3139143 RepID=A0ABU9HTW5_9FLAO